SSIIGTEFANACHGSSCSTKGQRTRRYGCYLRIHSGCPRTHFSPRPPTMSSRSRLSAFRLLHIITQKTIQISDRRSGFPCPLNPDFCHSILGISPKSTSATAPARSINARGDMEVIQASSSAVLAATFIPDRSRCRLVLDTVDLPRSIS
ncbi:hypothetical protein C8J56DRAFT_1133533, partial [Mycena floridula]